MAEAKRSYVVDENGNRTAVMLPIEEYEELLHDLGTCPSPSWSRDLAVRRLRGWLRYSRAASAEAAAGACVQRSTPPLARGRRRFGHDHRAPGRHGRRVRSAAGCVRRMRTRQRALRRTVDEQQAPPPQAVDDRRYTGSSPAANPRVLPAYGSWPRRRPARLPFIAGRRTKGLRRHRLRAGWRSRADEGWEHRAAAEVDHQPIRLLGLYRMRGKAEGHMGELMDVLAPALSSVRRPKSYRGRRLDVPVEPT